MTKKKKKKKAATMWENFISICDGQKETTWKELGLSRLKSLIPNTRARSPPKKSLSGLYQQKMI